MTLSTKDYLDTLKEAVQNGHSCSMLLTGHSMEPFLSGGRDTIWFRALERKPKRGDMVFFQRADGHYVMHRIRRVKKDGVYLIGDNQTETEGPVDPAQIFAVVYQVRRKGKLLTKHSFWWWFFKHIWLAVIPLRRGMIAFYRRFFTS